MIFHGPVSLGLRVWIAELRDFFLGLGSVGLGENLSEG